VKIYNADPGGKVLVFLLIIAIVVGIPYLFSLHPPEEVGEALAFVGVVVMLGTGIILTLREAFVPFLIDEKGIRSNLPFRKIFIAWDEMEYIGVGELHTNGINGEYRFYMYFSTTPLKKIYRIQEAFWIRQTKHHFCITYNVGLLEEILKHVGEERIKDVERIKNCPNPQERQPYATAMLRQQRKERREARGRKD